MLQKMLQIANKLSICKKSMFQKANLLSVYSVQKFSFNQNVTHPIAIFITK